MVIKDQNKEIFRQTVDDRINNYIEFIKEGDSLSGVFYGTEKIFESNRLLYFKSELENLKMDKEGISFTLNTFSYSNKSFYDNPNDSLLTYDKPDDIPYYYRYPLRYFGYRNSDTLRMLKVTMFQDSYAPEVLFIKDR